MALPRRITICTQAVDKNHPALGFFHAWLLTFSVHAERIDVICLFEGEHALPPHVHIHSLGKETRVSRLHYIIRFYWFFGTSFFQTRPEVVLFHMGAIYNALALPFFLLRRIVGARFLWWKTHGKVGTLIERLALMGCDTVLTAGGKSFPLRTHKVRVVGHAIDTDAFHMVHDAPIPKDRTKLLMVGRIVPIKRIEVALAMLASWNTTHGPRPLLTLIGLPDDPAYVAQLRNYVRDHHIEESVVWVGAVRHEDLLAYYAQAHLLLHPAYEAGFDKVVLEAMSAGVIPVTSIPSCAPMLETYDLFVSPNNHEGYEDAVKRIQDLSLKELTALRANLRKEVVTNHALSTMFSRIFAP